MPRKPLPPPVYPATPVARARAYLCKHYPKQAEAVAALSDVDAMRCMLSRRKAFADAERTAAEYMARPAGVRATLHARRCGAVGGRIGGRIDRKSVV